MLAEFFMRTVNQVSRDGGQALESLKKRNFISAAKSTAKAAYGVAVIIAKVAVVAALSAVGAAVGVVIAAVVLLGAVKVGVGSATLTGLAIFLGAVGGATGSIALLARLQRSAPPQNDKDKNTI